MKYDIYFHNDFDGRASAAVMLAFLRSRGDDIEHFTPVNYYLLPQWKDERFFEKHKLFKGKRNPAIIVDFLYHPKAAWWFEHHSTTFKKETWKKHFKKDKQHQLEPQYPSCCHLVYAALKKDFKWKPPKHLETLVEWLDVIDGAQYKSAKQTIEVREAALQVNEFVERKNHSVVENARIVSLLATTPLSRIALLPIVKEAVAELRKKDLKGLAFCRKNAVMIGRVCFLDRSGSKLEFPHFALQYLFPKMVYFVRVSNRDGLYHINVGLNPWRKGEGWIHVGELLKRFGGGGHEGVGGVEFRVRKEAMAASQEIVKAINNSKKHVR